MPRANKLKAPRDYPGRLTKDEYYALPTPRRWLYAMRAKSDLLELWRTCSKKPCRKHHTCQGDERCWLRPAEADLKNPNLGRPDFVFSYRRPKELHEPFAILEHLPFNPSLEPPARKSRGA